MITYHMSLNLNCYDCILDTLPTLLASSAFQEVSANPSLMLEDEVCLSPKVDAECLTPEVLLHIAYEVVSQLDKAGEFRLLSLDELSLRDFLVKQINALQLVVETQEDFVLPLAQDIMVSAQDLWPSQSDVASVGRYSSALCVMMARSSI
jgi:hypothetical protein